MFFAFAAHAEGIGADARVQMLDAEIERLTYQRDEKYTALKQCEKTTENFRVAGLATLIATGFGIYGNIKLYQKYNNKSGNGVHGVKSDTRSTEQKANDECVMFCADFPDDAVALGCSC